MNKAIILAILALTFLTQVASGQFSNKEGDRLLTAKNTTRVFAIRAKLTSYCTCRKCCEKFAGDGQTATGTNANRQDGVAAALWLVPGGSKVYIPGLKVNPLRNVDDAGGGMREMAKKGIVQFDIRAKSHQAALNFGLKYQTVYVILEEPSEKSLDFFETNSLSMFDSGLKSPLAAITEMIEAPHHHDEDVSTDTVASNR